VWLEQKKIRVPGSHYLRFARKNSGAAAASTPISHPIQQSNRPTTQPPKQHPLPHHPSQKKTTTRSAIKLLHLNGFYFGPWRLPQPGTALTLLGLPLSSTGLYRALLRAFMCFSTPLLIHFHIRIRI